MTFRAPVRDSALALAAAGHDALMGEVFPDLDAATVEAVLEAAGGFAGEVLAPLNRSGDREGAHYENGKVTLPAGFADAYRAFAAGGWNALAADPEHGGQGLSKALELAVFEMVHAANMSFGLCPTLSQGAIEALTRVGTDAQKALVLPKLISGEWSGTMNLTEPQAGSDLGALTARAEPDGQGAYRLFGEKIFITWGDHDGVENICHLVLARTPDAPPGVRGISLFLAHKREVAADGTLGGLNKLRPTAIEHKLGIHASPTCAMLFDGARAELVGELNQGLAHMFVMMNAARLQVGMQGVGIAERAFQQALAYAQERRQGRTAWDQAGGAIYDHPDVRRTLALMKAKVEAARGLCLMTAVQADWVRSAASTDARAVSKARNELLTPIAKAWSTEVGVWVASAGLQVHGGMGFIEETGAAQHYRDARIAPIYEGTNGIQALDLAGRKLKGDGGAAMRALCAEMKAEAHGLGDGRLTAAVAALEAATGWMLEAPGAEPLAAATPYLTLAGDVIGGWVLARQAALAAGASEPRLQAKATLAAIYGAERLNRAPGLAAGLMQGAGALAELSPEALGG